MGLDNFTPTSENLKGQLLMVTLAPDLEKPDFSSSTFSHFSNERNAECSLQLIFSRKPPLNQARCPAVMVLSLAHMFLVLEPLYEELIRWIFVTALRSVGLKPLLITWWEVSVKRISGVWTEAELCP
ncbi:unnamed protein product [Pleuronectes platessa]|uniref:Uncharacterized protein n=1 Tax=Pleuronectes platessa TaxID=8262 RepID=A0A9N7YRP3_PLEPL|nr:unnamed protein product [Pleuronectes platessa]